MDIRTAEKNVHERKLLLNATGFLHHSIAFTTAMYLKNLTKKKWKVLIVYDT